MRRERSTTRGELAGHSPAEAVSIPHGPFLATVVESCSIMVGHRYSSSSCFKSRRCKVTLEWLPFPIFTHDSTLSRIARDGL